MRVLLLGAATIALSGCSFLGSGNNDTYSMNNADVGHYGYSNDVVSHTSCATNSCLARWNVEGGIGTEFAVGGDVITGSEAHAAPGKNLSDKSWGDMYDMGIRLDLGGSYALNANRKVTATGFLANAKSAGVQNLGQTGAGQNLTGELTNYKSYGGELGLRQYFKPRSGVILKSIRPYVEGRIGVTHIDDISLTGSAINGVATPGNDVTLYDSQWVGSAAGLVGIETPLTDYSTIALETGIRYQGALESGSNVLAGSTFAGANNSGGRTTIPVMLRGRYRF